MRMKITLPLFLMFFIFCGQIFGQNLQSKDRPVTQENVTSEKQKEVKKQLRVRTTDQVVNSIDEDDPYQGREAEFLNMLTVEKLPDDFPKYIKGIGVKNYNDIVFDYLKKNKAILSPKTLEKVNNHTSN